MRLHKIMPVGAVKNADIFGKSASKLKDGERVVDISVDIENLPMHGKIVIAESNVLRMVDKLGYGVRSPHDEELLQAELESLRRLAKELAELRSVLGNIEQETGVLS